MQGAALAAPALLPVLRPWDPRRYSIALFARGLSVRKLAEKLKRSHGHVSRVLSGERAATDDLLAALREAIGEAGWAYATGQTDVLPTEGP